VLSNAGLDQAIAALTPGRPAIRLVREDERVRMVLSKQSWHDPAVRACFAELARAAVGLGAPA
jgi:hypothetical protein